MATETRISSEQAKEAIYQAHLSKDAIEKIEGLGSSASEIDGKVIPVDTIALLRAKTATPSTVWVSGYYTKGDGAFGSNIFEWDSTSTETDNGGTIIKLTSVATGRYKLKYRGDFVESSWFGNTENSLRLLLAGNILKIRLSIDYTITSSLTSNLDYRQIDGNGKTLTLLSGSTATVMLYVKGAFSKVYNLNINGNKANTINGSVYSSSGIAVANDDIVIEGCNIYDVFGSGIKGKSSRVLFENNNIKNVMGYGIFMDAAIDTIYYNNIARNNTIDIREGNPTFTQGILFTSKVGDLSGQLYWEITGNTVYGVDSDTCNDQAICIAVRGDYGICSNNITKYGSIGFSEGGIGTIVSNNSFTELRGTTRFGIEPSNINQIISNNIVTNAINGICASGSFGGMIVSNNNFDCTGSGIKLQTASGETNSSIIISGNKIKSDGYCIETIRSIQDITINNNLIIGPSINSGRGIFISNADESMNMRIDNNIFMNMQKHVSIYNLTGNSIGGIYLTNNITKNAYGTNKIYTEGNAVVGNDVSGIGNFKQGVGRSKVENVLDQKNNIIDSISNDINSPINVLTAGVGSTHRSTNPYGGQYFKLSGTGNTGWVNCYTAPVTGASSSFTTSDGKTVTIVNGVITTIV